MLGGMRIIRGGAFEDHASLRGLGAHNARLDDWFGCSSLAGSGGGVEEGASRLFAFALVIVPFGLWGARVSPGSCSFGEKFVPSLLNELLDQRIVVAGSPERAGFTIRGVGAATVGALGDALMPVAGFT